MINLRWKRNKPQKEFDNDLTTPQLVWFAGYGTGKSTGLAYKSFRLSYLNQTPGGLVCPSLPSFKKDMLPIYEEILDRHSIRYRYHKSEYWFQFPWCRNKLYVATAEKDIKGPNWGYALINEFSLISRDKFKQVLGRVRIKTAKYPQIAMAGTPEGLSNWTYEDFVEKKPSATKVMYGSTYDNKDNLHEIFIKNLTENYDPLMQQAFLHGQHVNLVGNRFYYSFDAKTNCDESVKRIEGHTVCALVDFNVDPLCATLGHIVYKQRSNEKMFIGFDQIELTGGEGADTYKLVQALKNRNYTPDNTVIYPDPAGNSRSTKGKSDIQILKEAGFEIKVKSSAPNFRKRQLATNNLLSKGLVIIHPSLCKGLKKDFEAVTQDVVTLQKEKDNPRLTHFSDGFDYFVDIEFPLSGQKPDSNSVKFR